MMLTMNETETTTQTVPFAQIAIGQKCRLVLSGKMQTVEKLETAWWGPRVTNARKCEGRKGLAFISHDREVEVIE